MANWDDYLDIPMPKTRWHKKLTHKFKHKPAKGKKPTTRNQVRLLARKKRALKQTQPLQVGRSLLGGTH